MDFANILFGGPCNRRCPFCIGQSLPERVRQSNLKLYPLLNQDLFVQEVLRLDIRQIVFTGTTTDPQLYRHEEQLLRELRLQLPGRQFSLHSNGALALKKMSVFNQYDKVCLSFPTFQRETYRNMMGSPEVPDLPAIVAQAQVPLKVSVMVSEDNYAELGELLEGLWQLGIPRVVLRQLYQPLAPKWPRPGPLPSELARCGSYRNNTIYDWKGMEVTDWCFEDSHSTSLNLFPDGTLSHRYLLNELSTSGGIE
jgi:pyruvate-formate lyase-activating enzyme